MRQHVYVQILKLFNLYYFSHQFLNIKIKPHVSKLVNGDNYYIIVSLKGMVFNIQISKLFFLLSIPEKY